MLINEGSLPEQEFFLCLHVSVSQDSIVGIVTGLWAGRSGVRLPAEVRLFSSSECPDWLCGSPKLLQNGYLRFCPWGNAAEVCSQPPTSISAEVKNEWSYTSSPCVCLYVVDRGTTYCTFASITDFVTYPANCLMVP